MEADFILVILMIVAVSLLIDIFIPFGLPGMLMIGIIVIVMMIMSKLDERREENAKEN